jgi:IS30 family transposase
MKPDLVKLIEEKLTQEQWSPDQISGWLMKNGAASISHERIYQHVWEDKKNGGTLYVQAGALIGRRGPGDDIDDARSWAV